jgi:hypothetical protein
VIVWKEVDVLMVQDRKSEEGKIPGDLYDAVSHQPLILHPGIWKKKYRTGDNQVRESLSELRFQPC